MGAMTIGALAKAGDVGVETIRYYQRRGLIATPPRGGHGIDGGIRRYDEEALRRLRFIRAAQTAGFTLDEIAELLALDAGEDRAAARALAEGRIAALDLKIAELSAARDALAKLSRSCAAGEGSGCPIIAAFENDRAR